LAAWCRRRRRGVGMGLPLATPLRSLYQAPIALAVVVPLSVEPSVSPIWRLPVIAHRSKTQA
jgi:hypothetical protein